MASGYLFPAAMVGIMVVPAVVVGPALAIAGFGALGPVPGKHRHSSKMLLADTIEVASQQVFRLLEDLSLEVVHLLCYRVQRWVVMELPLSIALSRHAQELLQPELLSWIILCRARC